MPGGNPGRGPDPCQPQPQPCPPQPQPSIVPDILHFVSDIIQTVPRIQPMFNPCIPQTYAPQPQAYCAPVWCRPC